jgi:hypothetical protein
MPSFTRASTGGARKKVKKSRPADIYNVERAWKMYELRKQFDESLGTVEIRGKEYPAAFVLWHVDFGDTNLRFVDFLQQNGIDMGPF